MHIAQAIAMDGARDLQTIIDRGIPTVVQLPVMSAAMRRPALHSRHPGTAARILVMTAPDKAMTEGIGPTAGKPMAVLPRMTALPVGEDAPTPKDSVSFSA
jgi:hypothetical protein